MDFVALSNTWYIVLISHLVAFLPLTAFGVTEFISAEWKSVRRTRVVGYFNLLCAAIPAFYIFMYCATQFVAGDWKEGSAHLLALFFALQHGARSAWGLWQLYEFRSWCAQSIDALRLMGVSVSFTNEEQSEDSTSSWSLADEFLVNNSVVDNQLRHGDVQSYLCYDGPLLLNPVLYSPNTWQETPQLLWRYVTFLTNSFFCIIVMIQDCVRFVFGFKTSGKLRQVPKKPAEVWVNWAVAFAAQGLQSWMSDFHVSANPKADDDGVESRNSLADWQRRASFYASEVLSTSILQLWPEVEGGESSENGPTGPMVWSGWEEKSMAHSGRVTRKELFEMAVRSGEGLPFGAPQYEGNGKLWSGEKGYRAYDRYLASKVGNLDVRKEFCPEIEKVDVNMLECLTVLLYLGVRSVKLCEKGSREGPSGEENNTKSSGNWTGCEIGANNSDIHEKVDGKFDQAVENLRRQLSLSLNQEATGKLSSDAAAKVTESKQVVASLPLSNRWTRARSRNKNVLRVGEVVDNWLALVAGDGLKFMLVLNNRKARVFNSTGSERRRENSDGGNESNARKENLHLGRSGDASLSRTQHFQKSLEKARLGYQLGDKDCICDWGMNFTMTFMGYRMEAVRSYLAEWVHRMNEDEVNLPSSFRSCVGGWGDSRIVLSEALTRSLKSSNRSTTLRSRQFHLRLLWELQEHFERDVESSLECKDDEVSRNVPQRLALKALCLLSFPSINILVRDDIVPNTGIVTVTRELHGIQIDCGSGESTDPRMTTGGTKKIELVVEPVCGPQKGQVRLHFDAVECGDRMSAIVSVGLDNDDEFVWEWWRDAFIGRLEGLKEWQEEHFMVGSVPVVPSSGSMNGVFERYRTVSKETFEVWKGWRPFRPEICMFEMKRNRLLKTSQPMRGVAKTEIQLHTIDVHWQFGFSKRMEKYVSYEEAELAVIHNATGMIRESISQGWRVDENEHEAGVQDDGEREIRDPFANAVQMCTGDVVDVERVLRLFETSVAEFGNEEAMEKGLEFVLKNVHIPDVRAAELVHKFVGYIVPSGAFTGSRIEPYVHEKLQGVVWRSCKKLVLRCEMPSVSNKLVEILELLAAYGHENMREVIRALMEVLLCRFETYEALWHFAEYFSVAFGAMRAGYREGPENLLNVNGSHENLTEEISASFETGSLEPDWPYVLRILERIQAGPTLAKALRRKAFMLFRWHKGVAMDTVRAQKLYERAVEEGGRVGAMFNLAVLLQNGAEGVAMDAVRAQALYERAIEDGGHVNAMNNLAVLLQNGAEGVAVDAVRAQALYERAVEEGGHVGAMFNLAVLLQNGADGVAVDSVRALALYERAIEEVGHVGAMFNLAVLLQNGAEGVAVDAVRAQDLYERAVEEGGHVGAMFNLAVLLQNGADGVAVDAVRAQDLHERAVEEGGHVGAMFNLAVLLQNGADGVAVDSVRALALYERAIEEGGHVNAMNNLAVLFHTGTEGVAVDAVRAQDLYERAIEEGGDVNAMFNLAVLLQNGADGVAVDSVRALALYERAIEEGGHVGAMFNLAVLLQNGAEGVAVDAVRAQDLYERTIEEGGDVKAMFNLAVLLQNGADGVAVDAVRAQDLHERAVEEGGHVGAMFNLAVLLQNGADGVAVDSVRALALYERAIEEGGHVNAMNNLAVLFHTGTEGVAVDAVRAQDLYERAIEEGGDVNAMFNLAVLLQNGADGVAVDSVRALALYERAIEEGGHVGAMFNLAVLLQNGAEGVAVEAERAEELFEMYERATEEG